MSHTKELETLVQNYIEAWSTTDAARRTAVIADIYAEDAAFYALSPAGPVECHGHEEITSNIAQINERDVQGKGLTISLGGFTAHHDIVRVTWSMAANGNTVMQGMDVLLLNEAGKIAKDYIFIPA